MSVANVLHPCFALCLIDFSRRADVINCAASFVVTLSLIFDVHTGTLLALRRSGALPVPYVPVRVTRGALIAHRYTMRLPAAEPRSIA